MNRSVSAFLVAPLWVPIIAMMLTFGVSPRLPLKYVALAGGAGALLGYVSIVAVGVPAFMFMRSRKWTSAWMSLVMGFVAAMGVFLALAAYLFFSGNHTVTLGISSPFVVFALLSPGVPGALVGITLWLIARPDRIAEARR